MFRVGVAWCNLVLSLKLLQQGERVSLLREFYAAFGSTSDALTY